ncbi:hypothetical protein EV426DRAFT_325752 [Tirmania nivea]|nr:hypothetical protein EV426DRAFT_325752 [Tirmania nivea]
MRYSAPSSSSSPDTHDYNNIPTTAFYHTSLYQTSPAKLVLTPAILAPTAPAAANKITKRPRDQKSADMRSYTGGRCTRFKHSSSVSAGMREWDVDALGGATGWFFQRLIEAATTTGSESPTAPIRGMAGERDEKVRGMEVDGDVDVDGVREQLERLKTSDAAERKDTQVVKAQVQGEDVLAMAQTLENLTVSNRPLPPVTTTTAAAKQNTSTTITSSLSSLPSNPFSALPASPSPSSRPTIPPYAPIITTITTSTTAPAVSPPITPPPLSPSLTATPTASPPQPMKTPLRAAAKPYYPSSPVLSARRYSPSNSSHSTYPGYKGLASSSGSGIGRRMGVDRVDRGKDKERVYSGHYTWSGYSSDGSYDHAPASPSSSSSSYSASYTCYLNSAIYSPSSPSSSSSSFHPHSPLPSSPKVHAGRIGKRRAASSGAGGSSSVNLSVGALASLGQAGGAGVMQMHMGMGVVVMGVRRVGRRAPSPEVQIAGIDRQDSGVSEGGMAAGGKMGMGGGVHSGSGDNDGDVVMMMDGDMDMDGEWEL